MDFLILGTLGDTRESFFMLDLLFTKMREVVVPVIVETLLIFLPCEGFTLR